MDRNAIVSVVSLLVAIGALGYAIVVPGPEGPAGEDGQNGMNGAVGPQGPVGPAGGPRNIAWVHSVVHCNIPPNCSGHTFDLFMDGRLLINDAGGGFNPFYLIATWETPGSKTVTFTLISDTGLQDVEQRTLSDGGMAFLQLTWS